jgi:hypothetical protein
VSSEDDQDIDWNLKHAARLVANGGDQASVERTLCVSRDMAFFLTAAWRILARDREEPE